MSTDPERLLAEHAARNDGVVSHAALRELGLTDRQIDRRLARGRLHLIHQSVYAVGHRSITRRGRWRAAVLAAGPEAFLCGRSGGAIRGLSVSDHGVSEVCVPPTGRRSRRGLRVRASILDAAERGSYAGLPVVSLARVLLDLAPAFGAAKLDSLMAEAVDLGLSPEALAAQLERSRGRRGVRALRVAADGYVREQQTASPPEASFLLLCGRHGLPDPLANVPVGGFEVDFYWPDCGLIVEIDGFAAHRSRARFEGDRERAVSLRAAGFEYLPFTPRQVERRPGWVAHVVLAARTRLLSAA